MAPRGSRALGSQTQPNSSDEQQQLARARYPRQCKAPAASTPASLSFPQVQQEQRRGSKKKTKTAPSSLPAPSPSAPTDSSQVRMMVLYACHDREAASALVLLLESAFLAQPHF